MTDDYQYKTIPPQDKNQGPFGLGKIQPIGYNSGVSAGGESGGFPSGATTGTPGATGDVLSQTGGGGGGVTPVTTAEHPFKIKIIPTLVNNQVTGYRATISAGTINNILPSNIISNNQLEEFSYGTNSIRNVVLTANSNQTAFTSATISLDGSAPPTQTPTLFALPSQIKILLGVVYNDTVHQVAYDNYILAGKLLYYTDNPGAPTGGIGYRAYFIWA